MSGAPADAEPDVIYSATRPAPDRPVLLTALSGAAVLNGAGELSWIRETRGAPIDWGGVYGQGVRLTGPWSLRVGRDSEGGPVDRTSLASLTHTWGSVVAAHTIGGLRLRDEITALASAPGIGRRIRVTSDRPSDGPIVLECTFDPFLAPVLIEGVRPHELRLQRRGEGGVVDAHGFLLAWESDPAPSEITIAGAPWDGARWSGDLRDLTMRWRLPSGPGVEPAVALSLLGGLERSFPETARASELPHRSEWAAAAGAGWTRWVGRTPSLRFPDAPDLEEGYRLARRALRMLYTAPGPGFEGLVAGYPWYSSLWCRDLAWMLPAVLWLGDFAWAERSLDTVFRYQARSRIPILAAERGELPMQVSLGPLLLYGTSDTSLYYPGLVRQHLDHTGLAAPAARWFPAIGRIIELGLDKTEESSGLFTNGGELAGMRQASSFGSVHVGFDAVDATIWDSTDRRDHAIDVQVLWAQALDAVAAVGETLGRRTPVLVDRADRVRGALRSRYVWTAEQYLYDSLRSDGTPVAKLRPNALRAVSDGLLDPGAAAAVVRRAASDDLTTPWGLRTLSSRDPGFDPTAYHDGQVWTIATAWAADAALRIGERDLGVGYLRTIARLLAQEGGYANECYRGDRPEAFDSCFLLGFSVAPFLSTLFAALWGIAPGLRGTTVELRPRFPAAWGRASIRDLAIGAGYLSLDWAPGAVTVRWTGPGPLRIAGEIGSIDLAPGATGSLPIPAPGTEPSRG